MIYLRFSCKKFTTLVEKRGQLHNALSTAYFSIMKINKKDGRVTQSLAHPFILGKASEADCGNLQSFAVVSLIFHHSEI